MENVMKLTSAICAAAAVALLAGCASYEAPAPAVAVATPAGPAVVATTAAPSSVYYDSFYGPVYTGYWGSDGMFHYRMTANGEWLIDSAHHFRRDAATGFQIVTITPTTVPPA
jgi:hypothetical protein